MPRVAETRSPRRITALTLLLGLLTGALIGYSTRFLSEPAPPPVAAQDAVGSTIGGPPASPATPGESAPGEASLAEIARRLPKVTASLEPPRAEVLASSTPPARASAPATMGGFSSSATKRRMYS
jgi:hypothetical protein